MTHSKRSSLGPFLSGAFLATLVGGYLLFGSKNATHNREKTEAWVDDAKRDVQARLGKMKDVSKDRYHDIVDTVADKYSRSKHISAAAVSRFRTNLKNRWDDIVEEAETRMSEEEEQKKL